MGSWKHWQAADSAGGTRKQDCPLLGKETVGIYMYVREKKSGGLRGVTKSKLIPTVFL